MSEGRKLIPDPLGVMRCSCKVYIFFLSWEIKVDILSLLFLYTILVVCFFFCFLRHTKTPPPGTDVCRLFEL